MNPCFLGKRPLDLRLIVAPEGQIRSGEVLPGSVVCSSSISPSLNEPEQAVIDLAAVEGTLGAFEEEHRQPAVRVG